MAPAGKVLFFSMQKGILSAKYHITKEPEIRMEARKYLLQKLLFIFCLLVGGNMAVFVYNGQAVKLHRMSSVVSRDAVNHNTILV
ncbi:MAG TPA: hypothetical protein DG942_00565, partial [Ruminococcaceae bacterium]|nr:hypothetical protein [Oscillospiraceae bacterium]